MEIKSKTLKVAEWPGTLRDLKAGGVLEPGAVPGVSARTMSRIMAGVVPRAATAKRLWDYLLGLEKAGYVTIKRKEDSDVS